MRFSPYLFKETTDSKGETLAKEDSFLLVVDHMKDQASYIHARNIQTCTEFL